MKRFISITENFLNEEMFLTFSAFARSTKMYDKNINDTVWSRRVVHLPHVPMLKNDGRKYIELVRNKIKQDFEIEEEIYTDVLAFNRWGVGNRQIPHADEANGFEWRKFGCILYLNDDYEGGEIYFPNQNITIKPKKNMLAFFPGDAEFLHGVNAVKNKNEIRYTLSTFWTYDSSREVKL